MIKGVNDPLLIPIAYFFISSLNGEQRASILQSIIKAVAETGARVSNITFDGLSANITMCEILGGNMKPESTGFNPFISNEYHRSRIGIIVDPSHCEKLVRNTLASKGTIFNENNEPIEWKYFVALEKFGREKDFIIVSKLNRKHIEWQKRKMKVRIAVETFSNSVADSIEYLLNQGQEDFIGAEATIEFIRYFNNIFDIFNSRSSNANIDFKRALNSENKEETFNYLKKVEDYIKGLKILKIVTKSRKNSRNTRSNANKFRSLLSSRSKTAFRGFLINIKTLMCLYADLIEKEKIMSVFPTFMLSQDFVELFFCKIRSRLGYNDNPNVSQFMSAYKKLLCNANIMSSSEANVTVFKDVTATTFSDILKVSSRRSILEDTETLVQEGDEDKNIENIHNELEIIAQNQSGDYLLESISNSSVAFIAGKIEDRILNTPNVYCRPCILVFVENEKVNDNLIVRKNSHIPCIDTYRICKKVNEYLKLFDPRVCEKKFDFSMIYFTIIQQ